MMRLFILAELDLGDVFDQVLPRLQEVGVQLLATIITLFLVYKLAWKPARQFIKKRQDYIEANIKDSNTSKIESEANLVKSQEVLQQAYSEYKQTVDSAKQDAIKVKNEIIEKADHDAKRQLESARLQIESEKVKAKEEIEQEIVGVALAAAQKVIGREINETDNRKFVKEFVEEIKS